MSKIILASRSPARRKLLKQLARELQQEGFSCTFECHSGNYEEDMTARKTAPALAKFLALQKALSIAPQHARALIIGADTFGTIGQQKLGKPATLQQARAMLQKTSNSIMKVHTGLAIVQTNQHAKPIKTLTTHTSTTLTFGPISKQQIEQILKTDPVLQVAGALTIEGKSGTFIKKINGDYTNVIGLPLFQLKKMLKAFI